MFKKYIYISDTINNNQKIKILNKNAMSLNFINLTKLLYLEIIKKNKIIYLPYLTIS